VTAQPKVAERPADRPAASPAVAPAQPSRRRPSRRPLLNLLGAVIVSAAVLYVAFVPAGPLPALGPAFNPITGAWTMAADAQTTDRSVKLEGLQQPVKVLFEKDGTAHISAQTDHDLFLATGYVHARYRLFQMDLMRRQGAGRLSEIVGKVALDSDRFELELGLLKTAQLEWSQLPATDPGHDALIAYAQGVNDRIQEATSTHQLDAMFTLLGYTPRPWTPIDSLLIKGDMTQTLNFTDTPLAMALLNKSLGADLTKDWFPMFPPNQQSPYDTGPYPPAASTPAPIDQMPLPGGAQADVEPLYQRLASLPAGLIATGGASNNWAVAGFKSASGGALLAGDPHLHLTLPAIWYQLTMDSPGYHAAGVSIPGTPVILIGHNQHIAWSLTDAQNQQTFFYVEREDAAHPGAYEWNGQWKQYTTLGYDIPVLGGATQHVNVRWSVHGPVISERGQTTSVYWTGNLPSQDLSVLLGIDRASSWTEFRDALKGWLSPAHNFVYADDQGNIGLISAGDYPQVPKTATPWLPMPGTGEADVTGTIPYDQIPQDYDPRGGVIWSANQRQVTKDYPYYIGTASNFFDPGYRANEIHRVLTSQAKLSAADMQNLQTDTRDFLAAEIVPVLAQSLKDQHLDAGSSAALALLQGWDDRMDQGSAAATIWAYFWGAYLDQTFGPWWKSRAVKVDMQELTDALGQDLEAWTLNDPTNMAFSAPGVGSRTAVDAQRAAFKQTISVLTKQLGADPGTWTWGRVHQRVLENLADVSGLNYGPTPDRGDGNTPLAAGGFPSTHGPSWRMVVDWGAHTFQAIYPGGQSENPASGWYTDRAAAWFAGRLNPMLGADSPAAGAGATWSLHS
jgi:penicillin amidase